MEVPESEVSFWKEKLHQIRASMKNLDGNVGLSADNEGLVLRMANRDHEGAVRLVLDYQAKKIKNLILLDIPKSVDITLENVQQTFFRLEREGMSGVIYLKKDGQIVIRRAFGMANREKGRENTLNTIFGTGSRPIDYTVAAILLLEQEGRLSVNDVITKFIDNVPSDKVSITLRHLMTGRSGLPDFFGTKDDWNQDLAWVDRTTAVNRMMSQKLLFAPGKGEAHSHGAFGLLAAIIEIVSGQEYYTFIREKFLDPAGMNHTGEHGESRGLNEDDFAVGGGPEKVGLPNIPPNWGPTSWLVKGSGGMYSTLDDLLKFYKFIRSGKVLNEKQSRAFRQETVNLDGSMRGFELFSAYAPSGNEVFLFINEMKDQDQLHGLMRPLEKLMFSN